MHMNKLIKFVVSATSLAMLAAGCGGGPLRCDPTEVPDPAVILSVDSVPAGTPVTIVASFDQPLFDRNAGLDLPLQDVDIIDASTHEFIGSYSDAWFDWEWLPSQYGVVLDGAVIDEYSIELSLEFPDPLVDGVIVQMGANNGDPHCYSGVFGEAPLAVHAAR
jgi:hypothetical protein